MHGEFDRRRSSCESVYIFNLERCEGASQRAGWFTSGGRLSCLDNVLEASTAGALCGLCVLYYLHGVMFCLWRAELPSDVNADSDVSVSAHGDGSCVV